VRENSFVSRNDATFATGEEDTADGDIGGYQLRCDGYLGTDNRRSVLAKKLAIFARYRLPSRRGS